MPSPAKRLVSDAPVTKTTKNFSAINTKGSRLANNLLAPDDDDDDFDDDDDSFGGADEGTKNVDATSDSDDEFGLKEDLKNAKTDNGKTSQ